MPEPERLPTLPIGLQLSRSARLVERAFDDALAAAGGSLPMWLVLLNIKMRRIAKQRELAAAVGIGEATLTHHLNAFERDGLLTRRRDPDNRRVQIVELTALGEERFTALREAALGFDSRLRAGVAPAELEALTTVLARVAANATGGDAGTAPAWAGLIERREKGP
jgi:MarR family transcriptional regulator for hemolysin